jgi:uncharacterized protein
LIFESKNCAAKLSKSFLNKGGNIMKMNPTAVIHAAALAALLTWQATSPAAAANPSFACTGNLQPAEAVVCSDDSLAALDRTLAADYKSKLDNTPTSQRTAMENAERAWITERNSCGANKSCISNAYQVRIGQLAAAAKPAPAPTTANPSFACTGSLLPAEAVVCSDVSLAALDRTLAADYKSKIDSLPASQRTALESAEKTWISQRNSCGTNKSCISNAYQARIGQLLAAAQAPPAAASCVASVGAAQANIYVSQCTEVTTATHPPCNTANACALIISEISRGCGLIGAGAPAFCAAYK